MAKVEASAVKVVFDQHSWLGRSNGYQGGFASALMAKVQAMAIKVSLNWHSWLRPKKRLSGANLCFVWCIVLK